MRVNWIVFKNFVDSRGLSVQFIETDSEYELVALDGLFKLETILHKNPGEKSNLIEFETNYKPLGNQAIRFDMTTQQSKKYRIKEIEPVMTSPDKVTTVYKERGLGYLWSLYLHLNSSKVFLTVIVDGTERIIPKIDLNYIWSIPLTPQLLFPVAHLGSNRFVFSPQEKIKFDSQIEIKMKRHEGVTDKIEVIRGFIVLTKEKVVS